MAQQERLTVRDGCFGKVGAMGEFAKEKVWLRRAFSFVCPGCGHQNFDHPPPSEFTDDEIAALREEHGIRGEELGDFVELPTNVTCAGCRAEWEATFDEELDAQEELDGAEGG